MVPALFDVSVPQLDAEAALTVIEAGRGNPLTLRALRSVGPELFVKKTSLSGSKRPSRGFKKQNFKGSAHPLASGRLVHASNCSRWLTRNCRNAPTSSRTCGSIIVILVFEGKLI